MLVRLNQLPPGPDVFSNVKFVHTEEVSMIQEPETERIRRKMFSQHRDEVKQRIEDSIQSGADPKALLEELNREYVGRPMIQKMIVRAALQNHIERGVGRNEVVELLAEDFGTELVRKQLNTVPDPTNAAHYHWLNRLMILSVMIYTSFYILLGAFFLWEGLTTSSMPWSALAAIFVALFFFGFAQDLRKGRGRDSYQFLAIIALLRLGRVLQGFENVDWTLGVNWRSLLECLYLPLLAMTAFFLARKLYPTP